MERKPDQTGSVCWWFANIKWERVPGFKGCYPEDSLAELKSRSRQNRSRF